VGVWEGWATIECTSMGVVVVTTTTAYEYSSTRTVRALLVCNLWGRWANLASYGNIPREACISTSKVGKSQPGSWDGQGGLRSG